MRLYGYLLGADVADGPTLESAKGTGYKSKRIPFGLRMKTERVMYEPPPPPVPKDFYPRKPPFWQTYGTEAYSKSNRAAFAATAFFCLLGAYIMLRHDDARVRWHKRLTGIGNPTPDETEQKQVEKLSRYMATSENLFIEGVRMTAREKREAKGALEGVIEAWTEDPHFTTKPYHPWWPENPGE